MYIIRKLSRCKDGDKPSMPMASICLVRLVVSYNVVRGGLALTMTNSNNNHRTSNRTAIDHKDVSNKTENGFANRVPEHFMVKVITIRFLWCHHHFLAITIFIHNLRTNPLVMVWACHPGGHPGSTELPVQISSVEMPMDSKKSLSSGEFAASLTSWSQVKVLET